MCEEDVHERLQWHHVEVHQVLFVHVKVRRRGVPVNAKGRLLLTFKYQKEAEKFQLSRYFTPKRSNVGRQVWIAVELSLPVEADGRLLLLKARRGSAGPLPDGLGRLCIEAPEPKDVESVEGAPDGVHGVRTPRVVLPPQKPHKNSNWLSS